MEELWETLGLQMPPEDYTREVLVQRAQADKPFTRLVQQFLDEQERKERLWTPDPVNATGRVVKVSASAATAPGSTRPAWNTNSCTFFYEEFDDVIKAHNGTSWGSFYGTFQVLNQQYVNALFNPGRKVSAAPEGDDEPAAGGFVATGPRDDLADHLAHYGLKPGTPEADEEAKLWVTREEMARSRYGELERASRLMVRDANLKRYARTEADTLIEEMMDL